MQDKVEILLATYNGERYIREQIDSILNQDYENWIVRACDDASTDKTYQILMEYKEKFPDKIIIEKRQKGFGSAKLNFAHLIQNSSCDYVMCCDQDDIWLPNKISLTLQEMKRNEKDEIPVLVHTDLKVVDAKLNVLSDSFFEHSNYNKKPQYKDLLIQNHVTGCTMMMNRALVDLVNLQEDYDDILMHDWLAAIVAAGLGKVAFVDCPTMLYRQHAVNSVGAKKYGLALLISKLKNRSIKKSLIAATLQAAQIAKTYQYQLGEQLYQLTYQYSRIFKKNKIQRIQFYFRYKVWKKGLPRQIWQLILG